MQNACITPQDRDMFSQPFEKQKEKSSFNKHDERERELKQNFSSNSQVSMFIQPIQLGDKSFNINLHGSKPICCFQYVGLVLQPQTRKVRNIFK